MMEILSGGAMRDPGNYWVYVDQHWTIASFDRYLWTLAGRVVSPEKIGQCVGGLEPPEPPPERYLIRMG